MKESPLEIWKHLSKNRKKQVYLNSKSRPKEPKQTLHTGGRVNLNFLAPPNQGENFCRLYSIYQQMGTEVYTYQYMRIEDFFESLKHTKQDLRIIEFENQVWNSLHKLVVRKGELILIFESKIHNFWTIFYRRTKISLKISPEIQKLGFWKF